MQLEHTNPAPDAPAMADACRRTRSHFVDIDEQAAALQGWNQEYLQLSAGAFSGVVQRLQLDGVGLFVEDLRQAVHQTGQVRPDVVAIGVPVMLQGDSRFCGEAGDAATMHVFSGRDGFEFRSPQRHVMLGIEVDLPLFESHVIDPAMGGAAAFASRARLHDGDPSALLVLRHFLLALFASVAEAPGWLDAERRRVQARDELLHHLAAAIVPVGDAGHTTQAAHAAHGRAAVPATHTALAERARQLVASRLDDPPTVGDLCALLGVSRRTLQSCFQATWNMGPLCWLKTMRLNAVRRRLKTAGSVTEAATQFAFWHFGHFATEYRAMFGEAPSQTLRRQRLVAADRHA
jgi:AraC family transcriptional regulator, ethanolamine operon transcriptional activator